MKRMTTDRHYAAYLVILLMTVPLCLSSCDVERQGIEQISQSQLKCEMVVHMAWGDGFSDLGYESDSDSNSGANMPLLRFQVDDGGQIYVTDPLNARILIFSAEGDFIKSLDVPISEDTELIRDVAVGRTRIAVATTDRIYAFDQNGNSSWILEWPVGVGVYGLCSTDMAGRKVQVDADDRIYACGIGGYERGGTIIQFDNQGESNIFYRGAFSHTVVGQDGIIYIAQLVNTDVVPPEYHVLRFDAQGTQVGEIVISGKELANAGLISPGLLIAVDAKGNLYGDILSAIVDGGTIFFHGLVQINKNGKVVQILEREKIVRPSIDVVDGEGNLYIWNFGKIPSEPMEIWRCD